MHLLQYQFSLYVLYNVILPTIIGIMQYQKFYKNFKRFKKLHQNKIIIKFTTFTVSAITLYVA